MAKKIDKSKKVTIQADNLPWKEPRVQQPTDDDLSKQWSVDYSIWDFEKDKLVRKRVILKGATKAERLTDAKEVIDELKKLETLGSSIRERHHLTLY